MTYKIAGIMLAAGLSRRSGSVNKLLASIDGAVMVKASLKAMTESDCAAVYVVTGHQDHRIRAAVAGASVTFIHNATYEEGMASSIRSGVQALSDDFDGVIIGLGDMPHVMPKTINQVIEAYSPEQGAEICIPEYDGKPGNPVLFGRRYFKDLSALTGDMGGKPIARANGDASIRVVVDDPGIHIDHDQVADL